MTDSVRDQGFRIVGSIERMQEALKFTRCMPCDKRTYDLLESARALLNKAVISSWEYADEMEIK